MFEKKNLILIITILLSVGCADTWNKADNRGGLFFSKTSDYIIVNQSGGKIMDVYKLKDVFISSPEDSDGWIFKDNYGNSINLGGDVKLIRINNSSELWEKYHEYHFEFENQTYQEMYEQKNKK